MNLKIRTDHLQCHFCDEDIPPAPSMLQHGQSVRCPKCQRAFLIAAVEVLYITAEAPSSAPRKTPH